MSKEGNKNCELNKSSDKNLNAIGYGSETPCSLSLIGGKTYSDATSTSNFNRQENASTKQSTPPTPTSPSTESGPLVQLATRIPRSLFTKIQDYRFHQGISMQEFIRRACEFLLGVEQPKPQIPMLGDVEVLVVDGQTILDKICSECHGRGEKKDGLRCTTCAGKGRYQEPVFGTSGGVKKGLVVRSLGE